MRFHRSDDLFLVQSRLYSPGYAGPGRWVIFRPDTRRAFSAIGSDLVPDIVTVLARASISATDSELGKATPLPTPADISQLVESGLLIPTDQNDQHVEPAPLTYLERYQRAVFDYPFYDYADELTSVREARLMDDYARLWPAPPSIERHSASYLPLPSVSDDDLGLTGGGLDLKSLAVLLRYTFGPVGEIKATGAQLIRRTSPSGGSRHPTELTLLVGRNDFHLEPGAYFYDANRHGLVPCESSVRNVDILNGRPLGFVIRSRVERAMWRYREVRALRPVLLDAGHIIETLSLLLRKCGYSSSLHPPPVASARDFSWLESPDLALLLAEPEGHNGTAGVSSPRPAILPNNVLNHGARVLTNPALYLTFDSGMLASHAVWPRISSEAVDLTDFRILSHCIPSNRGDRVTTSDGIIAAVPGATAARIARLFEAGALLDDSVATPLYKKSQLWVRYGWYLSLLAHLEVTTSYNSPERSNWGPSIQSQDYLSTPAVLLKRRTVRNFASDAVSRATLESTLSHAFAGVNFGDESPFRVFLQPFAIDGLANTLWEWNGQLVECGRGMSREEVRSLTIGQMPSSSGAVTMWLLRDVECTSPETYELGIIELGRLGHRVCLSACERGLGVFMTPAVCDRKTLQILGTTSPLRCITYLFSLGFGRR